MSNFQILFCFDPFSSSSFVGWTSELTVILFPSKVTKDFFLFLQELLETNSSTRPKKDLSPKLIHQSTERSELFTILRLNKFIFFLVLLQFLTQFGQF